MPPLKVHCRLSRCAQSSRCPVIITREYVILSLLFRNRTDGLKTKTTRNRIGHVGKESPDKLFVRRKMEGILALSSLKARQSSGQIRTIVRVIPSPERLLFSRGLGVSAFSSLCSSSLSGQL